MYYTIISKLKYFLQFSDRMQVAGILIWYLLLAVDTIRIK